jgi:hypothetical protein
MILSQSYTGNKENRKRARWRRLIAAFAAAHVSVWRGLTPKNAFHFSTTTPPLRSISGSTVIAWQPMCARWQHLTQIHFKARRAEPT